MSILEHCTILDNVHCVIGGAKRRACAKLRDDREGEGT